ncbi:MAG TPA: DUF1646 family protein [Spirochaetota bacterium]
MIINIGLFLILFAVLAFPFLIHKIEKELEIFLFVMGCLAITLTAQWRMSIIHESLVEPVKITLAVLIAGIVFRFFQRKIDRLADRAVSFMGLRLFVFVLILLLGLLSSIFTAIIAALILVEIISCLKYDRATETRIVVCACFAIGLGAALTPIGEPLSTIVIGKLKGEPYHANFFFLLKSFWHYIVPGVIVSAFIGAIFASSGIREKRGLHEDKRESIGDIFLRAAKVYLFVMALVFLGTGFKPIVDQYIVKIPYQGIYWINMISAVLDNATLAAAEISPTMHFIQIKSAMLGLLIAGGMLIPGNIPNIISAGKLKIRSREWAVIGVPVGLALMVVYFIFLELV